jgi:tripartite ATP-independent transporter DctP family solute receptor
MTLFIGYRPLARAAALAITATMLPLLAASSANAEAMKIRISTPAVESDWHAQMLTTFKTTLEGSAPGEFNVEIHLNATLFKQGTEPIAMQRGNLEMALISAQDIAKQIPAWSIFTAGYLIRDPAHQQAVFGGDIGKEMYALVADKMKIKILNVAYLGTRQLNLRTDKMVKTPADLNGVKLRMPGSAAWQFLGKALGANPTPMAFTEVYTALQTGAVDGQDNPLPTVRAAKFYEVTKQIVLTGHLVDGVFISMGGGAWGKLNSAQQTKVMAAAQAAANFNNKGRMGDEAKLAAFFKDQGLKVSTPDVDAFRSRVQKMYLESEFSKTWPKGLIERVNAAK